MPKQTPNNTQKKRISHPITKRNSREKEEFFRVFFEQAAVGVAQIETATGRFVRINQKYCDIVGYSVAQMKKLTFKKITHPDDLQQDLKNRRLLASGEIREFSAEKRYLHKNGSTVWVKLTVSPMWQPGEKQDYHIAVVEDITPRKQAEAKLQKAYDDLERRVLQRTNDLRKSNQRLKKEIRERKKAAEALRLSEARYRTLFESAGAGIAYYDTKGKLLLLNSKGASNLGGQASDFVGKTLWQFLDEDLAKLVFSRIKSVVKNGQQHEYEDTLTLAGQTVSFLSNFQTIRDENNKVLGVQVISQDITQRKRTEADLEKQRQLVQQILDTNPNVMYIFDVIERRNIFINQSVSKAVGLNADEFAGLGDDVLPRLMHPDDLLELKHHFEKLTSTTDSEVLPFEYRMKHKSGEWRWFLSQDRVFERTPDNQAKLIIGAAQDITERKQIEEALRESESKFRTLAETTSAGIFIFQDDLMSYVNPAAAKITGYTEPQLLQMKFWEVIHPEFRELVRQRGKARQKGTVVPPKYEVKIITRAGDERWISFTGCTITYQNKPAVLGTANDITDQKQADEALRQSEARYRSLFNNTLDAILVANDEGRYVEANPAACELLGYSHDKLLALGLQDITPNSNHGHGQRLWQEFIKSGEMAGEYTIIRKDGTECQTEFRAVANVFPGLHLSALRDISERKRAEETLRARARQQQVVAKLGTMALSEMTLDELFDQTVVTLAKTLEVEYSKILELLPDGKAFLLKAGYGWQSGLVGKAKVDAGKSSQAGFTLLQSKAVVVENLRQEKRFDGPPLLREHKVVSGMSVVIAGKVQSFGVLGVHSTRKRHFSEDDTNFLGSVANLLGEVIERERSAAALRESEERFRRIFEEGPLGMALVDLNYRFIKVNETLCRMTGYSEQELVRLKFPQITHPDDIDKDMQLAEQVFKGETTFYQIEKRYIKKNRDILWVNLTASVIRGQNDKALYGLAMLEDITERKRAEKELHQWADIFKFSQWGIVIAHAENKTFEMFNPAFAEMYGYSTEEFVGEPIAKVFAPEVQAMVPQYIEMVNKLGYYAFESKHVKKDGTVFPVWVESQIVKDETGKTLYRVANIRDITQRKQAEQALQRSEARLRNVLETVKLIAVTLDIKGNITFCNDFMLEVTGWKRKDIIGKNWFTTFIPPKIRKDLKKSVFLKAFSSAELPAHYENEILTRKGKRRLIAWNNTAFYDQNGQVISVTSIGEDVTERREAERALRESEEKYRSIVETTGEWIWEMSLDGTHTYSNPNIKMILGYEPKEIIGKNCFSFLHKEDRATVKKKLAEIIQRKQGWQGWVLRWRHKDGTLRYLESTAAPILDRRKKLVGFRGADRDITERKQSEEALSKSEEKYRSLFEESKDTVFITTPDGKFLDVNPAGVELFGYDSKEELMKANIIEDLFFNPEDRKKLERIIEREGFVKDYELTLKRKDGQKLTVLEAAIASRNEKGEVVAYRGILHDLTERKRLQEQLLHAQKMETIGTLAGGIAHDFNNLLTVISGNAEFGLQDFEPFQTGYPEFLAISEAARKARDLTHQLLIFSRRQVTDFRQIDFNKVLQDVLQMLLRIIPENIEIRSNLTPGLAPIFADKAQIQQVIMNLCLNARDAMPEGGIIEVKTEPAEFNAKSIFDGETDSDVPKKGIRLTITDTGVGMDEGTLDHIFEPFFTTKQPGQGTGLGLAVVYGIVQEHGGLITVASTVGSGTSFEVYLPFVENMETGEITADRRQELRGGNETILLVEDHQIVRSVGKRILQDLGYKVLIAKDGEEALRTFKSQADKFNVVVMDVVLPKLSGPQVFEKMHRVKGDLPVVFVTGYDLGAELQELKDTDKNAFLTLQKPYTRVTLGNAVREMLDRFQK